jgi:hypothetical protein
MTIAFSAHLYMPLRAIQRPAINETDPSRWTAFRDALARKQYGSMMFIQRKGPLPEQFQQYARYLSWQTGTPDSWDRAMGDLGVPVATGLRFALSAAALWGAVVMARRRKDVLLLVGSIFLMASIFFILYLNFKTGPVGTSIGEVRERDYFYADSFSFFSIFAALGAGFALKSLWNRNSFAWALMALPAVSVAINFYECDRSRDMVAHDYGVNLLESCTPGAVLMTNGDNDTFPLWFAQCVLGIRQDVIVSNLSLMNTDWYVYQLLDRDPALVAFGDLGLVDSLRPVFVWGPNFFHVTTDGMPMLSALDDSLLRSVFDQPWPWAISRGDLAIAVPGEGRGMQGSLGMQDLVLLSMVQRQPIHGRDIFLAGTVATDNRVYLDDYLTMEGIAFRLLDHPAVDAVSEERGIRLLDGYGYSGLADPTIFKDDQTAQLARNYVSAYHRIAYTAMARGDAEAVRHALDGARRMFDGMPASWYMILPSQSVIETRLVDGVQGPLAAAETLQVRAAQLSEAAREAGDGRYEQTAVEMQRLASEYYREGQFRAYAESLATSHEAGRWLEIEVDLGFVNYIAARADMDSWSAEMPGSRLAEIARDQLEDFFSSAPIDGRYDITAGGLAAILTYTEVDSITCPVLLHEMTALISEGRYMEAISMGAYLSSMLEDQAESSIVLAYADAIAGDPDLARRRAEWFLREEGRSSLESLAWQCAHLRDAPLCFVALSGSLADGAARGAERLAASPATYMAGLPRPGQGSGEYGWVGVLGGPY